MSWKTHPTLSTRDHQLHQIGKRERLWRILATAIAGPQPHVVNEEVIAIGANEELANGALFFFLKIVHPRCEGLLSERTICQPMLVGRDGLRLANILLLRSPEMSVVAMKSRERTTWLQLLHGDGVEVECALPIAPVTHTNDAAAPRHPRAQWWCAQLVWRRLKTERVLIPSTPPCDPRLPSTKVARCSLPSFLILHFVGWSTS